MNEWYVLDDKFVARPVRSFAEYDKWRKGIPSDEGPSLTLRVAANDVGEVHISTVFLGLDHGWGGEHPLLFETMVFRGSMDENQWRYATWDEAVAGHERVVAAVREGRSLDD